jgi:hypothetical protein
MRATRSTLGVERRSKEAIMRRTITLSAAFALSAAGALAISCGGGEDEDETTPYCAAKCDFEVACEGLAEADESACEDTCAADVEETFAPWNGECVDERLEQQRCVFDERAQNGCDDTAAQEACAEITDALTACYCSPMCTPDLVGNGSCDGGCNNAECDYDGGDCA